MKHTKVVTNQLKLVVINPRFPIKSRCKSCSNLHFSSVFSGETPVFPMVPLWISLGIPQAPRCTTPRPRRTRGVGRAAAPWSSGGPSRRRWWRSSRWPLSVRIFGYLWLSLIIFDYLRLSMVSIVIYGYLCLSMLIYGYLWLSMIIYDYMWFSMVIYDCLWLSMIVYGYLWLSMIICGFLWLSMIICGCN